MMATIGPFWTNVYQVIVPRVAALPPRVPQVQPGKQWSSIATDETFRPSRG